MPTDLPSALLSTYRPAGARYDEMLAVPGAPGARGWRHLQHLRRFRGREPASGTGHGAVHPARRRVGWHRGRSGVARDAAQPDPDRPLRRTAHDRRGAVAARAGLRPRRAPRQRAGGPCAGFEPAGIRRAAGLPAQAVREAPRRGPGRARPQARCTCCAPAPARTWRRNGCACRRHRCATATIRGNWGRMPRTHGYWSTFPGRDSWTSTPPTTAPSATSTSRWRGAGTSAT